MGNTVQKFRLWLFQDFDTAGNLEGSKSTSCGTLCVFGSLTFVPISWMCKKQTCVSRSSTESDFFLWIQVYVWTEFPSSILGIWILLWCTQIQIRSRNTSKHEETRCTTKYQKSHEQYISSDAHNTHIFLVSTSYDSSHKSGHSWNWWACFLVFLLHITFLFVFLFTRSRIESNSHCRSIQRRVWLVNCISNTDYQFNIGLNHETYSTTIFDQMHNYRERVSLSVSEQMPYQKSRSSSRKSAASTIPTVFDSNRNCFWQRERDNVSKKRVHSHSIRSRNLESRYKWIVHRKKKEIGMKVTVHQWEIGSK